MKLQLSSLKSLKTVQPGQDYSNRSRHLILSLKNDESFVPNFNNDKKSVYADYANILDWLSFHKVAATVGVVGAFVLIILLTISYLPGRGNGLVAEADEINSSIQIKLDEIEYYLNNQQTIAPSTADQLQTLLFESAKNLEEAKALSASSNPDDLSKALEKIKTAQETLLQINSLISQ